MAAAGQAPPAVSLPVGFTTFPDEIFRAPRSWVELSYPSLTYFHEADKGRPLRRLGGAATLLRRAPRGVPLAALIGMTEQAGGLPSAYRVACGNVGVPKSPAQTGPDPDGRK